jgi:hypothetical protein
VGLASGFSWISTYGAAVGRAFPAGGNNDYAVLNRISDGFNVNTEYTVPNMALAMGILATMSG